MAGQDAGLVDLRTDLAGIKMKSPIMIASGFVYNPETILRLCGSYAGAIVPKTVRRYETDGHDPPVFATMESGGGINAVGLSCPGVDAWVEWYAKYSGRIRETGMPVIFSFKPEAPEETLYVLRKIRKYCDGLELNTSCPNVQGGMLLCQDPKLTRDYAAMAKNECPDLPLFVKVSPNFDVVAPAQAAKEGGAEAVVAINTLLGKYVDPHTGWPATSFGTGGVSGAPILPFGLQRVGELYKANLGMKIVGCGGISGWKDMVSYFRAGADAVQWGTELFLDRPIARQGFGETVLDKLEMAFQGLDDFIADEGCLSLGEWLGGLRNV